MTGPAMSSPTFVVSAVSISPLAWPWEMTAVTTTAAWAVAPVKEAGAICTRAPASSSNLPRRGCRACAAPPTWTVLAYFDQQQLQGDVQVLRSSVGGLLSGSANLESTLALGDGKAALLGRSQTAHADTGMIVDVRSDYPSLELRADDSHGGGVTLKPGRNFVPISAYRPGHVQFDFNGANAPAATIQPATVSYHLNKGGVMHANVDVLRTFTVMGQVLDVDGNGQRGVHLINHADRSVSQDDGFFTLELSARDPVVELRYPDKDGCKLILDESRYPREGDMLVVGGLQCPARMAGK